MIARLDALGRKWDDSLISTVFVKHGLKLVPVTEKFRAEFFEAARRARERLGEDLVPKELLTSVMALLADYRAEPGPTALAIDDAGVPDAPRRARRLDWAALLQRVYAVDVLVCAKCEGPMRVIAFVQDEQIARRILLHIGLPARAPPRGRPAQGRSDPGDAGDAAEEADASDWPDHGSAFDGVDPPAAD